MSHSLYKYSYRAFGLDINSEIEITGFRSAPAGIQDITIHKGNVPSDLIGAVNKGIFYQSAENKFLIKIENVADFYVNTGREIVVSPHEGSSDNEISSFLNGMVIGALLHQRQLLPLHASTVIYKDQCLVFAGRSGAGKSTMAALLVNEGGVLVADDISVVDLRAENACVLPSFPAIKLWHNNPFNPFSMRNAPGDHAKDKRKDLIPVREGVEKYYFPVDRYATGPADISRIIILGTREAGEYQIKQLKGAEKFIMLKKYTYLFRGIPRTKLQQNHFIMASRMAASFPVTMLIRPDETDPKTIISQIDELINYN